MVVYFLRYLQIYYYVYEYSEISYIKTSWFGFILRVTAYLQVNYFFT